MPHRILGALHLLFAGLALAFAATGLLFFLFPDGTVRALNAAGSPLGFPPAPPSALRFWLSLGLAYMVLVTLLAAQIARDPRGRAHLMPLLARQGDLVAHLRGLLRVLAARLPLPGQRAGRRRARAGRARRVGGRVGDRRGARGARRRAPARRPRRAGAARRALSAGRRG